MGATVTTCGAGGQHRGLLALAALTAALAAGPARGDEAGYTFAVLGPLSGDNAVYGVNLQRGTQLAADQINAAGGIGGRRVALQFLDTQCQATQAANAAAKVASDPSVFAVIGDVCSSATMAAIPILARAGITQVSGDSTSPKITPFVRDRHYGNFARTIPSDVQQAQGMVKLAATVLNKARLAVLYASDDFGQPIYAYQKEALAGGGGATLVAAETYTPGATKDFTPQLTKIAAAKPDAILLDGYYNDAGTAVSQMARAGLDGVQIVASAGIDQQGYIDLGGAATEGTLIFADYTPANSSPENARFVGEFRAKYGSDPNEQATYGYEIPWIYKEAIEKGATRGTLAQMVRSLTFTGPTGTTRFDANGDVLGKNGVVLAVKDSKMAFDAEATAALNR